MKRFKILIFLGISAIVFAAFQVNNKQNKSSAFLSNESFSLPDGIYSGQSRSQYTSEPFWGHVKVIIKNNRYASISFVIRDSLTHENVDSLYGVKHYSGNPEYMQQCVNDGHGIELYPAILLEMQNIEKIDAITGATWSYNIFKSTLNEALHNSH